MGACRSPRQRNLASTFVAACRTWPGHHAPCVLVAPRIGQAPGRSSHLQPMAKEYGTPRGATGRNEPGFRTTRLKNGPSTRHRSRNRPVHSHRPRWAHRIEPDRPAMASPVCRNPARCHVWLEGLNHRLACGDSATASRVVSWYRHPWTGGMTWSRDVDVRPSDGVMRACQSRSTRVSLAYQYRFRLAMSVRTTLTRAIVSAGTFRCQYPATPRRWPGVDRRPSRGSPILPRARRGWSRR